MPRLSAASLRKHQEALREIYTLGSLQEFSSRIARVLPQAIHADYKGSSEMDYLTGQFSALREPVVSDEEQLRLNGMFLQHVSQHPLAAMPRRVMKGTAVILSETIGRRAWDQSGLYREFYRHVSTRDEMGMSVPTGPGRALCFFLWRDGAFYKKEELASLQLLRPHVEQAYRNTERFAEACGGHVLAEEVAEAVARGLVLLDERGRVREWSELGRRLAQKFFPEWRAAVHQLPEPLTRWVLKLLAQGAQAEGLATVRPEYALERECGRLTVRMVNRRAPGEYLLLFEEQRQPPAPECLQALGLTPRECAVTTWLAQGKTNPEIALILGANVLTIKVHLMHVFAKLAVESRTAAALRVQEFWRSLP